MAANDIATHAGVYAQRLIDNEYAQKNLAQAAESLRAARRRASKRRVKPTRDEKLRGQIRQAALSIAEAASALKTGRQKPKRRRGRRIMVVLGLSAGAAAAVLAANEELRHEILGGDSEPRSDSAPGTEAADPEVASVA